jgi:hypothetical protein
MKRFSCLKLALAVLSISLLSLGFSLTAGAAIQTFDPAWQKTSTFQVEDTAIFLGSTAFPADDPSWTYTPIVWDGPATNGDIQIIPNYQSDFWAFWVDNPGGDPNDWGKVTHSWFKTTLNLPKGKINSVKLVNKYNPDILSINDNLYVHVNGALAASGGTVPAVISWGLFANNGITLPALPSSFQPAISQYYGGGSGDVAVETGSWRISGGLSLPSVNFNNCKGNEITILMEDYNGWGGVGHLVFVVDFEPPLEPGPKFGQWLDPIANSNKQMKSGSTLPVKFLIVDPCGPVDDSVAQPHVWFNNKDMGPATSEQDPITGLPFFHLNIKLPSKGAYPLYIKFTGGISETIIITTK